MSQQPFKRPYRVRTLDIVLHADAAEARRRNPATDNLIADAPLEAPSTGQLEWGKMAATHTAPTSDPDVDSPARSSSRPGGGARSQTPGGGRMKKRIDPKKLAELDVTESTLMAAARFIQEEAETLGGHYAECPPPVPRRAVSTKNFIVNKWDCTPNGEPLSDSLFQRIRKQQFIFWMAQLDLQDALPLENLGNLRTCIPLWVPHFKSTSCLTNGRAEQALKVLRPLSSEGVALRLTFRDYSTFSTLADRAWMVCLHSNVETLRRNGGSQDQVEEQLEKEKTLQPGEVEDEHSIFITTVTLSAFLGMCYDLLSSPFIPQWQSYQLAIDDATRSCGTVSEGQLVSHPVFCQIVFEFADRWTLTTSHAEVDLLMECVLGRLHGRELNVGLVQRIVESNVKSHVANNRSPTAAPRWQWACPYRGLTEANEVPPIWFSYPKHTAASLTGTFDQLVSNKMQDALSMSGGSASADAVALTSTVLFNTSPVATMGPASPSKELNVSGALDALGPVTVSMDVPSELPAIQLETSDNSGSGTNRSQEESIIANNEVISYGGGIFTAARGTLTVEVRELKSQARTTVDFTAKPRRKSILDKRKEGKHNAASVLESGGSCRFDEADPTSPLSGGGSPTLKQRESGSPTKRVKSPPDFSMLALSGSASTVGHGWRSKEEIAAGLLDEMEMLLEDGEKSENDMSRQAASPKQEQRETVSDREESNFSGRAPDPDEETVRPNQNAQHVPPGRSSSGGNNKNATVDPDLPDWNTEVPRPPVAPEENVEWGEQSKSKLDHLRNKFKNNSPNKAGTPDAESGGGATDMPPSKVQDFVEEHWASGIDLLTLNEDPLATFIKDEIERPQAAPVPQATLPSSNPLGIYTVSGVALHDKFDCPVDHQSNDVTGHSSATPGAGPMLPKTRAERWADRLRKAEQHSLEKNFVGKRHHQSKVTTVADINPSESNKAQTNRFLHAMKDSGWEAKEDDVVITLSDAYCTVTSCSTLASTIKLLSEEAKEQEVDAHVLFGQFHAQPKKRGETPGADSTSRGGAAGPRPSNLSLELFRGKLRHPNDMSSVIPSAEESNGSAVGVSPVPELPPVLADARPSTYSFDVFLNACPELDAVFRPRLLMNGGLPLVRRVVADARLAADSAGVFGTSPTKTRRQQDPDAEGGDDGIVEDDEDSQPDGGAGFTSTNIVPGFIGSNSHLTISIDIRAQPGSSGMNTTGIPSEIVMQRRRADAALKNGYTDSDKSFTAQISDQLRHVRHPGSRAFTSKPLGGPRPLPKLRAPKVIDDQIKQIQGMGDNSGILTTKVPLSRKFAFNIVKSMMDIPLTHAPTPMLQGGGGETPLLIEGPPPPAETAGARANDAASPYVLNTPQQEPTFERLDLIAKQGARFTSPKPTIEASFLQRLERRARSVSPGHAEAQLLAKRLEDYSGRSLLPKDQTKRITGALATSANFNETETVRKSELEVALKESGKFTPHPTLERYGRGDGVSKTLERRLLARPVELKPLKTAGKYW